MNERIFLSPPHMGGKELNFINEAFASNYIAPLGPQVDAFEREFADLVGARHAVAVSSGTAALHLALRYAGVGINDDVFCSTLTFIASANAILYLGGYPVFVDSDRRNWNLDPGLLKEALARRAQENRLPKAVVLVHLYGQSADIDPIHAACEEYGVTLIEDAAEALGATYKGKSPGTVGLAGIYSFNGNKIITTSGGGMLVTDDVGMAQKVRFWATQARDDAPHYQHSEVGYNYRMSNVLAGIGRGQLQVLEKRVLKKREIFSFYKKGLGDLPGVAFMPEASYGLASKWLTCLTIDEEACGISRDMVIARLAAENIECRPVWKPLHMQPLFAESEKIGGSVAEELFRKGLCLPSGTQLTDDQLGRIVAIIRRCWETEG